MAQEYGRETERIDESIPNSGMNSNALIFTGESYRDFHDIMPQSMSQDLQFQQNL